MILAAIFASLTPHAGAQVPISALQPGERHTITRSYENSQQGSDGSRGSSSGQNAIIERVVAVSEDGVELEYDLGPDAAAEDRTRQWMFPARVLRRSDGSIRLLNVSEIETRLERWLAAANWTREACGRWIFTWNAFRIECDPDAVIEAIRAVDLLSADVREGALYHDPHARSPGTLRQIAGARTGADFVAEMEVDPATVRRERAEMDVLVGEIMQKPVTLDAALRARAREQISGTIEVRFNVGPNGIPLRRTTITRLEIVEADGVAQAETSTVMVERRPLQAPLPGNENEPPFSAHCGDCAGDRHW